MHNYFFGINMNNWHTFLQLQGASFLNDKEVSFGENLSAYSDSSKRQCFSPLTHLGALLVKGEDAKKFLQGQITCDIDNLSIRSSILGARCNPKGRTLVNFQLHEVKDNNFLLIMHHSLVASTKDELSKYAAFFKVSLLDVSEEYGILGVCLNNIKDEFKAPFSSSIYYYDDTRALIAVPVKKAEAQWFELIDDYLPVGTVAWNLFDIQSGFVLLQKETSGAFIPQMLNMDHLDAISFTKGCYTGQEIIARMKYLGTLKRKMHRVSRLNQEIPSIATEVYLPDAKQVVGTVVAAVQIDAVSQELLLVLNDKAVKSEWLVIGNSDMEKVIHLPLPYIK
ncbi:MAG: folate-binding protein YgfZ [Saprospiraceae bacterium]|jgi:folate-binding protein YgfZ